MKRYVLIPTANLQTTPPTLPAGTTSMVSVVDVGNRTLIKVTLPDGTAKTANTIADITFDEDGRQVDINAEALSPAARTVAKNFLIAQGLDVSQFDGDNIDDRPKLLRFILRRVAGWRDMTARELLDGWDA